MTQAPPAATAKPGFEHPVTALLQGSGGYDTMFLIFVPLYAQHFTAKKLTLNGKVGSYPHILWSNFRRVTIL